MTQPLSTETKDLIKAGLTATGGAIRGTQRWLKDNHDLHVSQSTIVKVNRETSIDWEARVASLEATVRSEQNDKKKLQRRLGDALAFSDKYLAAIQPIDPLKAIARPKTLRDAEVHAITPITDWHIGEVVNKDEVEGINEYNYSIARKRVQYLAERVLRWTWTHRHAYRIPVLHIPVLGDMISGNIHKELETTNEFPVPVACVKAAELISELGSLYAPHFEKVVFDWVAADNHSRMDHKPQTKQKALNSFGWMIANHTKALLANHKNIDINIHVSTKVQLNLGGVRVICCHGDSMRGWMGIPFYAMRNQRGMEAIKRLQTGEAFDEIMMGHFHIAGLIDDGIICGSLTGSTELDAQTGRWTPPRHWSFLAHTEKKKLFDFVRWDLDEAD